MEITLLEVVEISNKIFARLKDHNVKTIKLPVDYYWDIPKTERYDVYHTPANLTIGQIDSDWRELKKLLEEDSDILYYHLVWLSSIMRAIGEQIVY